MTRIMGLGCLLLASLFVASQGSSLVYRSELETEEVVNEAVPDHDMPRRHESTRIHYFAQDGMMSPYSLINSTGSLVGFNLDLVNEVCKRANRRCFTVLADNKECIFTDRNMDYGGHGLMSRWFDGCPGYEITTDRKNNFDFTLPYLSTSASFSVSPGNPSKFNPESSDYSKFTILHVTGASTNVHCLTRLDKKFGKVITAENLDEAKEAVLSGKADVLFSSHDAVPGLTVLEKRLHCSEEGAGIMLKMDSDISDWWDPAFKEFYLSGDFNKLCKESAEKYGGEPNCLPSPEKASPELLNVMRKEHKKHKKPDHLWKFVVSGRIAPFSYLNKEGKLVGFTHDMLQAVCERAGQRCKLTTAQVPECSVRVGELLYPGRGLLEGWFDACTGYFNTADRRNSWDFTTPYLRSHASFKVAPGNPKGFDPSSDDYSDFVLVRSATAITNDHCLNRLHKKFKKFVVVEDEIEAIDMVLSGKADAWFTKFGHPVKLDTLPGEFHCENVGTSIMTRKGSKLPQWWNPVFKEYYESGEFNRFCEEQEKRYNQTFPCLKKPDEIDLNSELWQ